MRIVGSDIPSLPPLDPLLPSENSWALQVESEEATHLHSKEERSRGSSNWARCGSEEASHESRDVAIKANSKLCKLSDRAPYTTLGTRSVYTIESRDDPRRQARSLRQNTRKQAYLPAQGKYRSQESSRFTNFLELGRKSEKQISPIRSSRFHHCHSQTSLNNTTMYADTKVSERAIRSWHTSSRSSDNIHIKHAGTQAARFSDESNYTNHERIQGVQNSESKGNARHHNRRTRDVKLADDARLTKSSQPADNERHDCLKWQIRRSSTHEAFRGSKGNFCGGVENASNKCIEGLKLEARSYVNYHKQSKDKGYIRAVGSQAGSCTDKHENGEFKGCNRGSALTYSKCMNYEGNGDYCIDGGNGMCQESISQCKVETRLASDLGQDMGTLLMQQGLNWRTTHEDSVVTSSQVEESISNTLVEGQRGNLQKNSSFYNVMPELCSREDAEVKEDDLLNTEEQYKMLASLLLDDSLDIGQDFDVMLAPGGPDLEFCGSIFDDDFELPVSMDVEASDTISPEKEVVHDSPSVVLKEPHPCVMRGLFQDGKDSTKHQSVSSNKLVEKHAVLVNTGSQPTEKQQASQNSSRMKPSSRVFVDVTNKFEIHTAPVLKETQENDTHRLSQRQRQVEFGKNTLGYERYCELVPRSKRKPRDPQTPNPKQICSKRSWDGQIRKWRRLLHAYDLPNADGEEKAEDFSIHKSRQDNAAASMEDNTRFSKSIENKGCNVRDVKKIKEDASLTIYDDWIVS